MYVGLVNVAVAKTESRLYHVRRRFLTQKKNPCSRTEVSCDFQPVEPWQTNIEQNQIRLQFLELLDSFHAIRNLCDLETTTLLQQRADELAETFEIFDYQNMKSAHFSPLTFSIRWDVIPLWPLPVKASAAAL